MAFTNCQFAKARRLIPHVHPKCQLAFAQKCLTLYEEVKEAKNGYDLTV